MCTSAVQTAGPYKCLDQPDTDIYGMTDAAVEVQLYQDHAAPEHPKQQASPAPAMTSPPQAAAAEVSMSAVPVNSHVAVGTAAAGPDPSGTRDGVFDGPAVSGRVACAQLAQAGQAACTMSQHMEQPVDGHAERRCGRTVLQECSGPQAEAAVGAAGGKCVTGKALGCQQLTGSGSQADDSQQVCDRTLAARLCPCLCAIDTVLIVIALCCQTVAIKVLHACWHHINGPKSYARFHMHHSISLLSCLFRGCPTWTLSSLGSQHTWMQPRQALMSNSLSKQQQLISNTQHQLHQQQLAQAVLSHQLLIATKGLQQAAWERLSPGWQACQSAGAGHLAAVSMHHRFLRQRLQLSVTLGHFAG